MQPALSLPLDANESAELLANDTILPSQYWCQDTAPRAEPEKRLMAAVLEEAIFLILNQARSPRAIHRRPARDAVHWIGTDDRTVPFAFASICDILGLEPDRIRRVLADIGTSTNGPMRRRRRLQAGQGRHRVQRARRRGPTAT